MVLLEEPHRRAGGGARAGVGGHDQHHVGERHRAAGGVGQTAGVHDLQQQVEQVRVGFFDLIEQHDRVRGLGDGLGQQAALVVTDVARRGTDQAGERMRLPVFGHVEADQGQAQGGRQLACHFGLAHPGRSGEQEAADRATGGVHARACHAHGVGDRIGGGVLAEHLGFEGDVQVSEHGAVVGRAAGDRHVGDRRDGPFDVGDAHGRGVGAVVRGTVSPGFVEQVDRLVGQLTGRLMTDRQVHRRFQRFRGVGDLVMGPQPCTQALQDGQAFVPRGLVEVDLLEAARQGRVLLEHAPELLEGGRAHHPQVAVGQGRLEQVAAVHGALAAAGADQGVDFVQEQQGVGLGLDLVEHGLDALFEVAAELGPRHHRAQVQGVNHRVGQRGRHLAVDDLPGQAFGQGGLADAGVTDQQRVVLAATAQDLHEARHFDLAADQGVAFPGFRPRVQIDRVGAQGIGRLFGSHRRIGGRRRRGQATGQHVLDGFGRQALAAEHGDGLGVFFLEHEVDRMQHGRRRRVLAGGHRVLLGRTDDAEHGRGQGRRPALRVPGGHQRRELGVNRMKGQRLVQVEGHRGRIGFAGLQGRHGVRVPQAHPQQVFHADERVTERGRQAFGFLDRGQQGQRGEGHAGLLRLAHHTPKPARSSTVGWDQRKRQGGPSSNGRRGRPFKPQPASGPARRTPTNRAQKKGVAFATPEPTSAQPPDDGSYA